jgi:hypothetical protein
VRRMLPGNPDKEHSDSRMRSNHSEVSQPHPNSQAHTTSHPSAQPIQLPPTHPGLDECSSPNHAAGQRAVAIDPHVCVPVCVAEHVTVADQLQPSGVGQLQ